MGGVLAPVCGPDGMAVEWGGGVAERGWERRGRER